MYKFIVQDNDLDGAVVKLETLVRKLKGKATNVKDVAPVQEPTMVDDYVDAEEITSHLSGVAEFPYASQTSQPATGELDSEGIPWDARIHSSSKEKVANGTWRNRRGVDKNLVEQVKASYRGNLQQQPMVGSTNAPANNVANITNNATPANVQQSHLQGVAPLNSAGMIPPSLPTMNSGHTLETFKAVSPSDVSLIQPTEAPTLTLQTCSGTWYQYRTLYTFTLDRYEKVS